MFSKTLSPNTKYIIFLNIVLFTLLFIALPSFAASEAENNITAGLCRLVNLMKGNVAKVIATMAIFFVAISMFFGKINWGTALVTALAIVILFSAPAIVNFISGAADGEICPAQAAAAAN